MADGLGYVALCKTVDRNGLRVNDLAGKGCAFVFFESDPTYE